MDDKLPKGWELIEEWEGSFIFENSKLSFSVNIDFEALLKEPYTIEFLHTKGYLKLVNFGSRLISGDNLIFEKKYDYRKRIIRESISDRVG
jgi:hypothetical protein